MKSKLIIVEGLPGSGKSTLAGMIADALKSHGEKIVCVDEGEKNHPADYDNYDFPSFEIEREKILEKWKEFVANTDQDTVYVFNCIFLQNPMCETMMRFGLEEDISKKYILEIANIIRPLHPIIIYIDKADIKVTIDNVLEERGNGWLNAVIDYHTLQGFGKDNNLVGYDGYIACLEERKARELCILKETKLEKYIVSDKEELWKIGNKIC